jgi:ABC-type glycerol-3-phosphate transport system substrate-binding protein
MSKNKSKSKNYSIYKILTLSLLGLSAYFMTGCTIPFLERKPESISIRYESLWEKPGTYEGVFNSYTSQNPNVVVNFEDKSAADITAYKTDLLDRLKNNRDVPDIVRLHVSWLPEFKDYLAPAPSDLFSAEMISSQYYPAVSSLIVYNTTDGSQSFIYGVPFYYDQLMLVYNKKDFEEANFKSTPVTWEQFFRTAYFLTKKDASGKVTRSGAAFGSSDIEFYSDIFGYLLGNAAIDFPAALDLPPAALESVFRVLNRSTDWDPLFQNSGNAFASRNTSMIIVPSWRVNDILTANPNIELAVAPLPSARQDRPMNWPTFFVEAVPASSKHADESWKMLKFMSSEESLKDMYSKQASVRRLPSLPSLKSLSDTIDLDPILKSIAVNALNSQIGIGNGSAFVMSDRSGNTACVTEIKKAVTAGNPSVFVGSKNEILQACGLK